MEIGNQSIIFQSWIFFKSSNHVRFMSAFSCYQDQTLEIKSTDQEEYAAVQCIFWVTFAPELFVATRISRVL